MKKEYDFSTAIRGPVIRTPPTKERITIRLDKEVLNWFRREVHASGGGSYQALINDVLKEHIRSRKESLETTLRRVVRQELAASGKKKAR